MKQLILSAMMVVLAGTTYAANDEPAMSFPARSESLELPGLTAGCHVCEWRPKLNQKPALEQCGTDEQGNAKVGTFECGFSDDCQRVCNFITCEQI